MTEKTLLREGGGGEGLFHMLGLSSASFLFLISEVGDYTAPGL